jgi:hypothetical protein
MNKIEAIDRPHEREDAFFRQIISEYLQYGSVDAVFRKHSYNLPISYPGFQRLLDKWGIVKAAGPNSKLSEAITFMVLLSDQKMPLETLYHSLPPSFKTSMATMHRILHNIKEGVIRRYGTALILTPDEDSRKILIAEDVSTPRLELGKPFGAISLPMGYSKGDEKAGTSILRVLQQEVFSEMAIERRFPYGVIPKNPKPFMYFDIADVRVAVYHLTLPSAFSSPKALSSSKLVNYRYLNLETMISVGARKNHFRSGIKEMAIGYNNYLAGKSLAPKPVKQTSLLNLTLSAPALAAIEEV